MLESSKVGTVKVGAFMKQYERFYQIVAALMWREGEILLVEQRGPGDPFPTWALPGGQVEAGELWSEALAREVREETGLTVVNPGRLLYLAQIDDPGAGRQTSAVVFEVCDWDGELQPRDPGGLVKQARFLSIEEALRRLEALPWRAMGEPASVYLKGETSPGAVWFYRIGQEGSAALQGYLDGRPCAPG